MKFLTSIYTIMQQEKIKEKRKRLIPSNNVSAKRKFGVRGKKRKDREKGKRERTV